VAWDARARRRSQEAKAVSRSAGEDFGGAEEAVGKTKGLFDEIESLFSCACPNDKIRGMTPDERAQLIEDIDRSAAIRESIVEQARLSKRFDIAAAWQKLESLDASINKRVAKARSEH
jgi:hypothetical protein